MHLLGLPFRLVEKDGARGETRTAEFLALNPNGRVPLMVLPDGRRLSESNAMLLYLAEGSKFLPVDRYERALVNQWLFFEQYEHEPTIAVARSWISVYPDRMAKVTEEQIAGWHREGYRALDQMEQRLAGNDWMVGNAYSIADIALYAYTHVAEAGGFRLEDRPNVCSWLQRMPTVPGYVPMD